MSTKRSIVLTSKLPIDTVIQMMDNFLHNGWDRDHEAEDRVNADSTITEPYFVYTCEDGDKRPMSTLFFMQQTKGLQSINKMKVVNIVPKSETVDRLDDKTYNYILNDFYISVLSNLPSTVDSQFCDI